MPAGGRNGLLLEEAQVLLGNLVILLLFLKVHLTQQVPGLLCFPIPFPLQVSQNCQNQQGKKTIPVKLLNLLFPGVCLVLRLERPVRAPAYGHELLPGIQ